MTHRPALSPAVSRIFVAMLLLAEPALGAEPATPDATLDAIADELADLRTNMGAPTALPDNSAAALRAREASEDRLFTRLRALNPKSLSPPEAVTFKMLQETLAADRDVRVCRRELWNVDHISGWQVQLGTLAARQPIGSAAARTAVLATWQRLPQFVDVEIAKLDEGLRDGYSAPQAIVSRVIAQLDALLAIKAADAPFLSPAKRDNDAQFSASLAQLIAIDIYPALRRYRTFLSERYLPHARSSLAISALPHGKACYRALLRRETTLDSSPQEIFDRGTAMIRTNRAAVVAMGRKLFGSDDYDEILRRLAQDPANQFESAEEVVQFSKAVTQRAQTRSASLFFANDVPPVEIVPFPEYQRNTGMGAYYSPARDEQPPRFLINPETWRSTTKGQMEVASVHEAWPGHHMQVSIARSLPHPNKFAANANYTAYIEGWARYVERLADEEDLYTTPYARLTWRAKPGFGMVVDPGIHAFGWSRERAASFLMSSGLFNTPQAVADMIDRIAVMPAQLTAYDTGGSEFVALRERARRKLGAAFDLRKFHQQVLGLGFVPLSVLRDLTNGWIEQESRQ